MLISAFNALNVSDKIAVFANSVDPDAVAHDEPPHQDLYFLPSGLLFLI